MRQPWTILQKIWVRVVLLLAILSVVFIVFDNNNNNNSNGLVVQAFSNHRNGFRIVPASCTRMSFHRVDSIECTSSRTSATRENDLVYNNNKHMKTLLLSSSRWTTTKSTTSSNLFLLDPATCFDVSTCATTGTTEVISFLETATAFLTSSIATTTSQYPTSPEPIHTAFTIATFFPQPFWLLLILLPNNEITKRVMGGLEIPLLCCLIHFFIVACSIGSGDVAETTAPLSEFNNVFDPNGDPQYAFMGMTTKYPNFVAEEWSHVLTWDLFVGRYIWIDGIKRNIFTSHSVLLSNLIGPPGLLLHWFTCTILYKKPIVEPSEIDELMNYEQ